MRGGGSFKPLTERDRRTLAGDDRRDAVNAEFRSDLSDFDVDSDFHLAVRDYQHASDNSRPASI